MRPSRKHPSGQHRRIVGQALVVLAVSVWLGSCAASSEHRKPTRTTVAPAPPPSPPVEPHDPLSYGRVTSTVKKGTTTQSELVALFGGPSIATLDSDGTETWVYERTASETTSTGHSTATGVGTSQAERLDLFFGLGFFIKGKDRGQVKAESDVITTVSHSIKTLTVVVKFNQDKTVKDFSARASYF